MEFGFSGAIWDYRRYLDAINSAYIDLLVCGSIDFVKRLMSPLLEAQRKGVTTYVLVYKVPENQWSLKSLEC